MSVPNYETSLVLIVKEVQYEISLYEYMIMENKHKSLKYLLCMIVPMIIVTTVIYSFHFGLVSTPTITTLFYIISFLSWFGIIRCMTGCIRCGTNIKICKDGIKLLRLVITKPEFLRVIYAITKVTIDEDE